MDVNDLGRLIDDYTKNADQYPYRRDVSSFLESIEFKDVNSLPELKKIIIGLIEKELASLPQAENPRETFTASQSETSFSLDDIPTISDDAGSRGSGGFDLGDDFLDLGEDEVERSVPGFEPIQPHELAGAVRPHNAAGLREVAPGVFEDDSFHDLSTGDRDSLNRVRESIGQAVANLPEPAPEEELRETANRVREALATDIEDIPVTDKSTRRDQKFRPQKAPRNRFLQRVADAGRNAVDFFQKEEQQEKPSKGWGSSFARGFNRLIKRKNALEETVSAEEEASSIRPEKVASIVTPLEQQKAFEAIRSLEDETDRRLNKAFETIGRNGKMILEKVERLGEKFNKLPKSVRYGTGIAIAGLGATGAPLVVPTLALATAFRAASGAGLYATLHKSLEHSYAKEEAAGKKVSVLRKQTMGVGAVAVSAFAGYAIGQYISSLFPADAAPHVTEPAASAPVPESGASAAAQVADSPAAVIAQGTTEQAAGAVVESTPATVYVVGEGENLWNIVKDHLMRNDSFANLSEQTRNIEISKYLAVIQESKIFPDINTIHPGDIIDFSQFDGKIPDDILKHSRIFTP